MKDAARLLGYFAATILFGAVAAPILFWAAQSLAAHGIFPALATFDFEAFFHRALMLGAILFLWPFLRWLQIKSPRDLELVSNRRWGRDLAIGFFISALPILCCGVCLVAVGNYTMRTQVAWGAVASVTLTALVVPLIEEALFRGLFLGVLLRGNRPWTAALLSAGIFSIVHFLKAPDQTTTSVEWTSGFTSLLHSLDQFAEPMLVLAGFTTLFLIGVILADSGSTLRFTPAGVRSTIFQSDFNTPQFVAVEPAPHQVLNISTRGFIQGGDHILIAGFIVGGNGPVGTTVVVRALGPSLATAGITDPLPDPVLEVRDASGALIALNNNWQDAPPEERVLNDLAPTDPLESGLQLVLRGGNFTAIVYGGGTGASTGTAVVEVYHLQL